MAASGLAGKIACPGPRPRSELALHELGVALGEHLRHLRELRRLAHAEVHHHLLGAAGHGHGAHLAAEPLDLLALAAPRVGEAPEDLGRLPGAVLEDLRALDLQQGRRPPQLQVRLQLLHGLHLVADPLDPVVRGLDEPRHLGHLPADHRVLHQGLPEGLPLVGELDGLLEADAAEAVRHGADAEALVVEVAHDVLEALVLLAEQVAPGHPHVVEGDVRGPGGPDAGALHLPRREAGHAPLDHEEADAAHPRPAGPAGDGEVVREDAVGDPLLLAVQDVVVAVELRRRLQVGHVAARRGLGDAEAADLLAPEAPRDHPLLHLLRGVVEDGREADGGPARDAPEEAAGAGPRDLVVHDELVEPVGLEAPRALPDVLLGPRPADAEGQAPVPPRIQVDLLRDRARLVPVMHVGHQLLLHVVPEVLPEHAVRVVVERRVVSLVPRRVAEGVPVAEDVSVHALQERSIHGGKVRANVAAAHSKA
mmetsp:Transcript_71559/g.201986  ORF Transcript_71559/g.201986 Transcript_71559/m.201986 type:complete len:480 (+) Transcript_71559:81-1520(+)